MAAAAAATAAAYDARVVRDDRRVFDLVRVLGVFCEMASARVLGMLRAYKAREPAWDLSAFLERVQVSCGSMKVFKEGTKEPLDVWCLWTVLELLRSLQAVVLPAELGFHRSENAATAELLAGAVERLLVLRHALFHDNNPVSSAIAHEALQDMTTVLQLLPGDWPVPPVFFSSTPAGKEVEMPWQSLLFLHTERVLRGLQNDLTRIWDMVQEKKSCPVAGERIINCCCFFIHLDRLGFSTTRR